MDTPSVDPKTLAGDPVAYAAVVAMRLLQDRHQHTPEEHLDSRERHVLRQLRAVVRRVS